MRSNFKEVRISLYVFGVLMSLVIIFYLVASMFTSMGYKGYRESLNTNAVHNKQITIILDPGHGGEDPGACDNGLIEKDLNLDISLRLKSLLQANGYKVILTRENDRLLYNSGEESNKKYYDIRNRAAFAESFSDSIFISIHMNKFAVQSCKGLQVFYSPNSENSLSLAEKIQKSSYILQPDNIRNIKASIGDIYLLDNLEMPSVLIECGFLSNVEEANLLQDDIYKSNLSLSIYCGIVEYLEFNL